MNTTVQTESRGTQMARHTEFDVLQRALSDPWPENEERDRGKPTYRWRNEAAAERVRRFFRDMQRLTSPAEPTNA
jgi:hypothetical protein